MVIPFIKNNLTRIFLVVILIFTWFIDYKSDGGFTFCLYSFIIKKNCFACGTLRGISAVLHLDFKAAFTLNKLNALSIPVLAFVFITAWKNNRI